MTDPNIVMLHKGRYIVTVPIEAGDYYISGTGHLCARSPIRHTVFDNSLQELGIKGRPSVSGRARSSDVAAANFDLSSDESAVIVVTR